MTMGDLEALLGRAEIASLTVGVGANKKVLATFNFLKGSGVNTVNAWGDNLPTALADAAAKISDALKGRPAPMLIDLDDAPPPAPSSTLLLDLL